jgi:hypothetical protein
MKAPKPTVVAVWIAKDFSDDLWRGTVELSNQTVYTCVWRTEKAPTEEMVRKTWAEEPNVFNDGY